jgi:exonuclease SbcD
MAALNLTAADPAQVYGQLEERLAGLVQAWLEEIDPALPVVLAAHASVQGAVYGGERTVMLGSDLVLSGSLVKDPRLDYVALGHIHKSQNLNENAHPPVIYPGSIERVDFGEAGDDKFFVVAHVERGKTNVEWRKLTGVRLFVLRYLHLESQEGVAQQLRHALPPPEEIAGAVVRLVLDYPREWESLIDEAGLREHAELAFEFQLIKRPQMDTRIRLPDGQVAGSLTPLELLDLYWRASHVDDRELQVLNKLAEQIIQEGEEKL